MSRQDLLLWFALSAVWGASFVLISLALESFPPLWVAFLRSVFGAGVLWAVLRARRQPLPPRRLLGVLLAVALLNNALPWALFAAGQQTVSSGVAAILNATTPLFSLGLALLLRDAQVNLRLGVGVLLGLAGVALTVSGSLLTGHATVLGTALILVAAASYAFATALSKARLGRVGVLGLATAQLSLAALMLAPAALLGPPPGPVTLPAVAGVAALGVFGSGLAYLMFYALLSRTSATQTTAITYALPVWGLFWGALAVQLQPSGHRNGHCLDAQGRLVACSHGERALLREDGDGGWTVLASHFQGRRLNSPNDVALHPDGSLWFSDPDYGLSKPEEGYGGERELPGRWVFRLSPIGELSAPIRDRHKPNGLAFLNEHTLLLADTGDGATHRYRVRGETAEWAGEHFRVRPGKTDGLRVDVQGRIWSSAGDGVHVLTPDGAELARIPLPETVSNLAFGGPEGNLLFITASTGVYLLETRTRGA